MDGTDGDSALESWNRRRFLLFFRSRLALLMRFLMFLEEGSSEGVNIWDGQGDSGVA